MVIASTRAVYGEPGLQPIAETAPETPTSPYGSSKLAADRAAADYAAAGEVGAISLRAFTITGATRGRPDHDFTRLIPELLAVRHGAAPEIIINGDGSAVRDFLRVADVADASPAPSRPANPAPGAPTTSAAAALTASATSSTP
jgi:UDP-glucose 4-epimerase